MKLLNKFYNIRENIPKFIKYLTPKFVKRKINKKFFSYYFLLADYQKLPLSNYENSNNFQMQKNLIEKFNVTQKQNSFMTCPYLHQLILMKYKPDDDFSFLDIGGEYIDFFLELRKNFKNVKYYVFNLEKINSDFELLKLNYKYENLIVIKEINTVFNNRYDFVNFGSCIQYFDNYETIIRNIVKISNQIFFSGTTLFESENEDYDKHTIVKQVNIFPEINYCYFFNKIFFYDLFYRENFVLLFESKNLTDDVNFKNFEKIFKDVEYKDFFFIKK